MYDQTSPAEYSFSFRKRSSYKGKTLLNVDSSGKFALTKTELDNGEYNFTFKNLEYNLGNNKDPLIFTPIVWRYNRKLGVAGIVDKKNFKPYWNRYRDKYRNVGNRVIFMIIEKLYFNTPLGMEYDAFSNGIHLPFFINSDGVYIVGQHYKGLDYLSMPLDIPLETTFLCTENNEKEIHLEGWITLHEANLDALLRDQGFKSKAKYYHLSRDFSIVSKIEVVLDTAANIIKHIAFTLSVKGEDDLTEEINYTVDSDFDSYHGGIHKIFDGKKYTEQEWEKYEKEQNKPGRNFSLLDDN